MAKEEEISESLGRQFPALGGKIRIQRARRMWVEVERADFETVLEYLRKSQGFVILCTMTGLDKGENLGVIYHLAREDGIMLNVEVYVPKADPVIKTVTGVFPGADHYEREIVDLLGFKVEGLAPGFRYPLTDDWPAGQYPLRKDWKLDPSFKTGKIEET
ncbi:MAG TPA: NADH-quinone oxidoreductase subunit C [bacterium]|nr:NADH-quinone oxidoreductase subunit C [bacterium]